MALLLFLVVATRSTAAEAQTGNCSDPSTYKPNPLTHKSNPCDDFCADRCAFSPTAPQELELIRMTPRNVSGIANKDTGDDAGDLFFTLVSATKPAECAKANPPPWAGCFLNGDNVFLKYSVQVDGLWGIYQECNPAKASLPSDQTNSGSFACCGGLTCSGPTDHKLRNSSAYCYCDRTNRTVGQTSVYDHFSNQPGSKYMPAYLANTAKLIGGSWFSTPAAGECTADQTPGDGSGCTWKVKELMAARNQSCVKDRVYGAVEKHCSAAFQACSSAFNRTDPCYSDAFFESIGGNSTLGCAPMTREELLAPWQAAFAGDCPPL